MTLSMVLYGNVVAQARPKLTSAPYPHAYDPKNSRDFKNKLAYSAQEVLRKNGGKSLQGAVSLGIAVYMSVPTSWSKKKREQALNGEIKPTVKPDVDNIAKSIMDALTGVWYSDDKQIISLTVMKQYAEQASFCVIAEEQA